MTRTRWRWPVTPVALLFALTLAGCSLGQPDPTQSALQPASTPAPVASPATPLPTATVEPAAPTAPPATIAPPAEPTAVPTAAATEPIAFTYDLGESTIVQSNQPEDGRFREMPVRLNGVMALPMGEGPFPVVVIVHGNHPGCPPAAGSEADVWPCAPEDEQANYQGFAYLVEGLADRGYLALALNANAQYTLGFGEPEGTERLGHLIDQHLAALAAATRGESDAFSADLTGKADMSRLALVGHSQGGELTNILIRDSQLDRFNVANEKGYGPVYGLLQVAPPVVSADSPGSTVPLATILPACDGDVVGLDGQSYYEAQRLDDARADWATSVYLLRANHNGFNSVLEPDELPQDSNRADCNVLLAPESQQDFLTQYAADFLDTVFAASPDVAAAAARIGLDATGHAPHDLYGFAAQLSVLPGAADEQRLLTPAAADELETNLLGGEVNTSRVTPLFCEAGYYTPNDNPFSEPCRRVTLGLPGYPASVIANWQRLGAEFVATVPEPGLDATAYDAVTFRAAVDPLSIFNAPDSPQSLSVRLTDAGGASATVVVPPDEPALAFPSGVRAFNEEFGLQTYTGHVYLGSVRVPLSAFEGVDLRTIVEVALAFDQTKSGSMFLADLGFSRTPRFNGAYSTLLSNADGALNDLKGIGRLNLASSCTATFIQTSADPAAPAYAVTNGHCAQEWLANDVILNQPAEDSTLTFNYFADTQDAQLAVPVKTVAYSTMKGRDVAVLELDATVGDLRDRGIEPFPIAAAPPDDLSALHVFGVPVMGLAPEQSFLRQEDCAGDGRYDALEFIWHFFDVYRNTCQDIYGGSSGSPVFAGSDEGIFALINTTTIGGLTPCYLGTPCEVTASGTELRYDTSYATPIDGLTGCFGADGVFDVTAASCPLDDGRQLLPTGAPTLVSQAAESWNATLTGDLPFYRYKTGAAGAVDCRAEEGYSSVLSIADNPIINDPVPQDEGSYYLCIVAGESETVDDTWQRLEHPTVTRIEIDRTPPTVEPRLSLLEDETSYRFEPIFAVAELSDYDLKVGPSDATDCDDPEGYFSYRRVALSLDKADDPQTICVIGFDMAGNAGAPKAFYLGKIEE